MNNHNVNEIKEFIQLIFELKFQDADILFKKSKALNNIIIKEPLTKRLTDLINNQHEYEKARQILIHVNITLQQFFIQSIFFTFFGELQRIKWRNLLWLKI